MLFALVVGARLLSPAGFMPSFANGGIAIVACPEAGPARGHQEHDKQKSAQPCPYAAGAALGALGGAPGLLLALVFFPIVWTFAPRLIAPFGAQRLRPPPTGPPILI
ncbi:hypothetical protein [Sphingomonas flavescens]|uniref:hypothetical protein n=1 Tax=Sphingomonas flavescens TaxID=3132797 RepID=UPI002805351D|nr:hypothetical protein [Sphingomonas limnosediminicola]